MDQLLAHFMHTPPPPPHTSNCCYIHFYSLIFPWSLNFGSFFLSFFPSYSLSQVYGYMHLVLLICTLFFLISTPIHSFYSNSYLKTCCNCPSICQVAFKYSLKIKTHVVKGLSNQPFAIWVTPGPHCEYVCICVYIYVITSRPFFINLHMYTYNDQIWYCWKST